MMVHLHASLATSATPPLCIACVTLNSLCEVILLIRMEVRGRSLSRLGWLVLFHVFYLAAIHVVDVHLFLCLLTLYFQILLRLIDFVEV